MRCYSAKILLYSVLASCTHLGSDVGSEGRGCPALVGGSFLCVCNASL